jgi:hypothetical protein
MSERRRGITSYPFGSLPDCPCVGCLAAKPWPVDWLDRLEAALWYALIGWARATGAGGDLAIDAQELVADGGWWPRYVIAMEDR